LEFDDPAFRVEVSLDCVRVVLSVRVGNEFRVDVDGRHAVKADARRMEANKHET
jgi:hypothetical protein